MCSMKKKKKHYYLLKSARIVLSYRKLIGREGIFVINRKSSFVLNITHS